MKEWCRGSSCAKPVHGGAEFCPRCAVKARRARRRGGADDRVPPEGIQTRLTSKGSPREQLNAWFNRRNGSA